MSKTFCRVLVLAMLHTSGIVSLWAQTPVSAFTKEANQAVKQSLPLADQEDFNDAKRGFITTIDEPQIKNANGSVAYTLKGWDFLQNASPETANPSLWRQSQLNRIHGLFEVVPDKIYQIRGFDIANMTFVRTAKGWIIIDVTSSKATAKAGYDLFKKQMGNLPIQAVIITHPHADHYSGIDAITEGAPNKEMEIIAPVGFFEHAINENVMAGPAMARRATYMFGMLLPKNEFGSIGSGLGQINALGEKGIVRPTIEIGETGQKLVIDGTEMEFIFAPESEAPSEIMIYFPQYKSFCVAEEMNRTLHNLVTLRGAKVRNGLYWSKYIDEALVRYGDEVEVSFSTHHWPTWGNKKVVSYWENQRDMYRFIHDQTLYLANKGYTPNEIAEAMKMPDSMARLFYNREYYGTISHNSKAQYQLYFGWFDGNPANLNPLPPVEQGKEYVAAMGGEKKVLKLARKSYVEGNYRWCATLLNHLVFANPAQQKAKELLADAYSQLAYQAESGPWRNFYLTGAQELRNGAMKRPILPINEKAIADLNPEMLFDWMAIQVDGVKAAGKSLIINLILTDSNANATLILQNSALSNRIAKLHANPTATLKLTKGDLIKLLVRAASVEELVQQNRLSIEGDATAPVQLIEVMGGSDSSFNMVEP